MTMVTNLASSLVPLTDLQRALLVVRHSRVRSSVCLTAEYVASTCLAACMKGTLYIPCREVCHPWSPEGGTLLPFSSKLTQQKSQSSPGMCWLWHCVCPAH